MPAKDQYQVPEGVERQELWLAPEPGAPVEAVLVSDLPKLREAWEEERKERWGWREGEDPPGLQEAEERLLGYCVEHDDNCGIPHPADPDQSDHCTCGIAAAREAFSLAVAEALDVAHEGAKQQWEAEQREEVERVEDTDDPCLCGHVRHEHHYEPDPESGPDTGRCAHCPCACFALDGDMSPAQIEQQRLDLWDALRAMTGLKLDADSRAEKAEKEQESLKGKLARLLGPRTPKDGVTANDHWIAAVAAVLDRARKAEKALTEAEDRFEDCDNCQRTVPKDDLETIWCREPESGEQVDARICLACRLKAELADQRERLLGDEAKAALYDANMRYQNVDPREQSEDGWATCLLEAIVQSVQEVGDA